MKRNFLLSIIIAAKNEAKNLPFVLKQIKKVLKKINGTEMIVVDGHSLDNTREIAREYGCRVVMDHRKGKGEAMRVGASRSHGDILVFIDADGSHNPSDIKKLLDPILFKDVDHVSGSRMLGGSDELHKDLSQFIRLIGSALITLAINYKLNVRLTDCQNGFRAIKKDVFQKLDLKENITTIEQEMIIKSVKMGYRLIEVPTHEYERRYGKSHIAVWKYAPRYVYSCLKYLFFN